MTRTDVYVADNGLVKVRDGINIRMEGVVLEGHPAVAKYPAELRLVGSADDATVATIKMLGDAATLPRLWDRITPVGAEPPTPGAPRGTGFTVDDVRREGEKLRKPEPDCTGPTAEEVAEVLGITSRTVSTLCCRDGGFKSVVPYRK